jgi:hypothetical protein
MSTSTRTVTFNRSSTAVPLATGVTFARTDVIVTDSTGVALPTVSAKPTDLSVTVPNVTDGKGSVTATDFDSNGATLGAPVTQAFDSSTGTGTGGQFFPLTGLMIT